MYTLPASPEARHRRRTAAAVATAIALGGGALLVSCHNDSAEAVRACYTGTVTPNRGYDTINGLVRTILQETHHDPTKMDGVADTQIAASGALRAEHGAAGFIYPGDQITVCVTGKQVEFESAQAIK